MTKNYHNEAAEEMEMFAEKECNKCELTKPLNKFYKRSPIHPNDYEIYRRPVCKACTRKVNHDYANQPEVVAARKQRLIDMRDELEDYRLGVVVSNLPTHKICRSCEIDQPLTNYALAATADYHRHVCMKCTTAQRNRYHKTPKGIKALARRRARSRQQYEERD